MNKINVSWILLFNILLALVITGQDRQTNVNSSSNEFQPLKGEIDDALISTREAFLRALTVENKPGGIVVVENSCMIDEIKIQRKKQTASLNESLDFIIKSDPQYKFSIEDGVVNLTPTNNEPDFFKIQINEFRLKGDLNITLALEELLQLPEIRNKAAEINLNKGLRFLGLSPPPNSKSRLKFELRNVTLRQALNEIARRSGRAVWGYKESSCNGKTNSSLEFLVY